MFKFKVGDRVVNIRVGVYKYEPIEVILLEETEEVTFYSHRYYIKYLNVYNVQNTNMTQWVHEDDLDFDKSYYRDTIIDEIINLQ